MNLIERMIFIILVLAFFVFYTTFIIYYKLKYEPYLVSATFELDFLMKKVIKSFFKYIFMTRLRAQIS